MTTMRQMILFDKDLTMQQLGKRLTVLLHHIRIIDMLTFGLFVTGLSVIFTYSSSGGIVDRMIATYSVPRNIMGGAVLVGALIMAISTIRTWKTVGLIPYLLYVTGVWGVTYNGYAWQAAIIYTIHALIIVWILYIHTDDQHESK